MRFNCPHPGSSNERLASDEIEHFRAEREMG